MDFCFKCWRFLVLLISTVLGIDYYHSARRASYRHFVASGKNKRELQETFNIPDHEIDWIWELYGHYFPRNNFSWGSFGAKQEPYFKGDFPVVKDYTVESLSGEEKRMLKTKLPKGWELPITRTL